MRGVFLETYEREDIGSMVMTDPIADMLTRVRNANSVYHSKVEIPACTGMTEFDDMLDLKLSMFAKGKAFIR